MLVAVASLMPLVALVKHWETDAPCEQQPEAWRPRKRAGLQVDRRTAHESRRGGQAGGARRGEGPLSAHPLWCPESATPAVHGWRG
eukprot:6942173-Pyramimonas_sp.AAC.1